MKTNIRSVQLKTDRFILRTLTPKDATERYANWLTDPEVNRFLQVRHAPPSRPELVSYIESHDGFNNYCFGVFTKSGLHIGNFRIALRREHANANMSVMIGDKDYWGSKTVLECRSALLDFLFNEQDVYKVQGGCTANNAAALYNYRRQGWKLDGIQAEQFIVDNKRVDLVYFAMFKHAWMEKEQL
jgi:[ribosomal protein S5]-alanine N-acetyltransferase